MSSSWLITGSNRGIGLALVELLVELKDPSNTVIATTRKPNAESLQKLVKQSNIPGQAPRLYIFQLDVQNPDEAQRVADIVGTLVPGGIDYFVGNAGVNYQPETAFEDLDLDLFLEELKYCTVDVIRLLRPFLPLILKSNTKKVVFLTTVLSSLDFAKHFHDISYPYSVAKAALNMLVVKWGGALAAQGVLMSVIHPGWVETDMGDSLKRRSVAALARCGMTTPQIPAEESAEGVVKVIRAIRSPSTNGMYSYDGSILPW
ncbi:hypothetical protein MD484_g3104, partial [Candolleomyces efflorescens]